MVNFGGRLRDLRSSRNWSQHCLGQKIDISASQIAHYESGDRLPSIEVLIKLSYLFGVTADYLLGIQSQATIRVDDLTDEELLPIFSILDTIRKIKKQTP